MNTIVTSREAILDQCCRLAAQQGLEAVSMRTVAEQCGVAVGSIYNYFPSKAELVAATVQQLWQDIFYDSGSHSPPHSFPAYILDIFQRVQAGAAEHPNFFSAHALSFTGADKSKGRAVMEAYFTRMQAGMLQALQGDSQVRAAAFDQSFTQENFVAFVFSSLMTLFMQRSSSCDTLLEVIRRTIYD